MVPFRSKSFALTALVLLPPGVQAATNRTSSSLQLEAHGVRIFAGTPWKTHLRTELDGIPFIDASTLYASRPHFGGRYYGYEDDPAIVRDAQVKRQEDGATTLLLPLRAPRGEFTGTQFIELLPGRKMRLTVDARLTSGVAGAYEHKIGGIYTGWMQGRTYTATDSSGRATSGTLPQRPHTDDPAGSTILTDIRSLRVDTPFGPLTIETSGTHTLSLVDYRMNRFFEGQPFFWLGVREHPLPVDAHLAYQVDIQFPPESTATAGREARVQNPPQVLHTAYEPEPQQDLVIPTPKSLSWGDGMLNLPADIGVYVESSRPDEQTFLEGIRESVLAELESRFSLRGKKASSRGELTLRIVSGTEAPSRTEEYRIRVTDHALVEAATTAGLVNGVRTLSQLYRREGGNVGIRRCEVSDWPSMPFRGVHFFSGAGGHEIQRKMIREVVAPLKLNAVVYHCDNIQWDSHPEIRKPGTGMPKKDARLVAAEAQVNHVGIIPLMNTFGHSNWFLDNDTHRHLADNPANPFAYNPLKPGVYELIHDIYGEAVELFDPAYFHIGHDEITLKGFPLDPELQKIGARKLILDDIQHYRDWFAAQGIRTMIWGDMFIGPGEANDFTLAPTVEEARLRRAGLPRDIVICDWHYTVDPPEKYRSLRVFNEDGFDVIASTWYHSKNIAHFAKAAADAREVTSGTSTTSGTRGETLGILETTWAGSNLNEKAVQQQPDQFAAYVMTAEAAWTGGAKEPDALGFDYRQVFARIWNRDRLPAESRPGWTTDLSRLVNYRLGQKDDNISSSSSRMGEFEFGAGNTDLEGGVLLAARFNPPGEYPGKLTIPVETTATSIMFATGATYGSHGEPPICTTTLLFDDGTTDTIEWKLGQMVMAVDDSRATPGAMVLAETKRNGSAPPQFIHGHLWTNPKPAQKIRSVEFASTHQGSGFVLFGMTGLQ